MRINGATCPLDNTPVHPESYPLAEQILAELGFSLDDLADKNKLDLLKAKIKLVDIDKLATKLNAGVFTVKDILDALTNQVATHVKIYQHHLHAKISSN